MTQMMMDRDTVRAELNHSCTSQCPLPCPYTNMVDRPETDIVTGPQMAG